MPKPPLERIKAIFAVAVEKTGAARQAFIRQACGEDAELLAEVIAFLSASERAGDFLESPTAAPSAEPADSALRRSHEGPGTRIGVYKLLELIGEGGFGSVFMAEQERPVRRKVALKIIKLGMDTKQVIARFEAERQALAIMDHPNIAKVFEAGATETGRPYFVMELVRGVPITEYCDSQKLTTRQRAELFVQVCQAIQHAHQKGVIHRDIKPNNVLVTMHDDKPVPKVIDFGIAKATAGPLTDKTLFTEFRQFMGTPAYMSPEQTQLNELDVDTRSDIYSLGVLIYELLTGTTPFSAKELRSAAYDEIRRIIREVEPPKPSTRLGTLAANALGTIAGQRQTDSRRLTQNVRGDLDWIVMKCLEKDRKRRYETANALAKDIERYLGDEPVEAAPPSRMYLLRRFARRHHRSLLIAGVIGILLTATTVVSVREAVRARRAQAAAVAAEEAAKTETTKRALVANFLERVLDGVRPSIAAGRDTTLLREISEKALSELDNGLADQPEVRAELYSTFSAEYFALNYFDRAADLERKALALRRSIFKGDNAQVASTLSGLANAVQGRPEAIPLAEESLAMHQRLFGDSPSTCNSFTLLGEILRIQNEYSQAEPILRQGIAMRQRLHDTQSVGYASNLFELGVDLWFEGKVSESLALTRQSVDIKRKLQPDTLRYPLGNLSRELEAVGDLQDAKSAAKETLATAERVLPNDATNRQGALQLFADVESDLGDYADAEQPARQSLKLARAYGSENEDGSGSVTCLGLILFDEHKYSEAEPVLRESLQLEYRASPPDDRNVAGSLGVLGSLLSVEGKFDEADQMLRHALELNRKFSPPRNYDLAWSMTCLANSLSDQKKYAQADEIFTNAVEIFHTHVPPGNPGREWGLTCFAISLLNEGNYPRSEPLFREALAATRETQGDKTAQSRLTAQGLTDLLSLTGRAGEAQTLGQEFALSNPATRPSTWRSPSALPIPSFDSFNYFP